MGKGLEVVGYGEAPDAPADMLLGSGASGVWATAGPATATANVNTIKRFINTMQRPD